MGTQNYIKLDDLEDFFKGSFTATSSATSWKVEFTTGVYAGYKLILTGIDFSGTGGLPVTGTINTISLFSGSDPKIEVRGLSMPAAKLVDAAGLGSDDHESEDHDDRIDDDILGGEDDDDINGDDGDDHIEGGHGSDHLHGGRGKDSLDGGDGKDDLDGGAGDDRLYGRSGDDILRGNSGKDALTGGNGHDKFVFKGLSDSKVAQSGRDVITDFRHGDKIELSKIDADATLKGNQRFKLVAEFTGHAGELQWDKTSKGFYVSGDVNGDKIADFSVQVNTTAKHIYSYDFVL